MTNLSDFLKVKKVRFIANDNRRDLTNGKVYDVIGATYGRLKIHNDNGGNAWYDMDFFELVIEPSKNPLQNIELTPEFETEASEPKFKVGDKVYYFGEQYIYTYLGMDIAHDGTVLSLCAIDKHGEKSYTHPMCLCHATPENYELLSKLYPHIKFEAPPKPLTGSDLARAMFDAGHEYVVGRVGNHVGVYYTWSEGAAHFFEVGGTGTFDIEPIDPRTGEPLTEAVLDE